MEKIVMSHYRYLFFDLDHTLWDYDKNAGITLSEMFERFKLAEDNIVSYDFFRVFHEINNELWHQFNHAKITRDTIRKERFRTILTLLNAPNEQKAQEMSEWFLEHAPRQVALMDGAKELLDYLSPKYPMLILTNGFDAIQRIKMEASGIHHYFQHLISSDTIGVTKPDPRIFRHALKVTAAAAHEVLMIGDNPLSDIEGSLRAGIDCAYYNPSRNAVPNGVKYTIESLKDLHHIL